MISDHLLTVNSTAATILNNGEGTRWWLHSEVTAATASVLSVKGSEDTMTAPNQGGGTYRTQPIARPVFLYYIVDNLGSTTSTGVAALQVAASDTVAGTFINVALLEMAPALTQPDARGILYWQLVESFEKKFIKIYPIAASGATMAGKFIASMTYDTMSLAQDQNAFYGGVIKGRTW